VELSGYLIKIAINSMDPDGTPLHEVPYFFGYAVLSPFSNFV
jgi:hypothetical protein